MDVRVLQNLVASAMQKCKNILQEVPSMRKYSRNTINTRRRAYFFAFCSRGELDKFLLSMTAVGGLVDQYSIEEPAALFFASSSSIAEIVAKVREFGVTVDPLVHLQVDPKLNGWLDNESWNIVKSCRLLTDHRAENYVFFIKDGLGQHADGFDQLVEEFSITNVRHQSEHIIIFDTEASVHQLKQYFEAATQRSTRFAVIPAYTPKVDVCQL